MLKIIRTDVYLQAVIIAVVTAALWAHAIVVAGSGRWWTVAAMALTAVEGLVLESVLVRNKMIGQNTLLPMLFFILAMSLGTTHAGMTPMLVGMLFLILCVGKLMVSGTLLSLPVEKTFGAAACLSLATVFCPTLVMMLLPVMLSMVNYSLYSWRDWTMLLLGFAAPYIPLELYYFLTDDLFYRNYLLLYEITDIGVGANHTLAGWIMTLLFALLTLVAVGYTAVTNQSHGTNYTKNSITIMLFLAGGVAYTLAYGGLVPVTPAAYAIPFAFCTTALFHDEKKKKEWIWSIVLALLLLAAAVYNLFN